MLSPPVLSVVTGSTEREIFRLVEAGLIHFVEAKRIYACPDCCGRVFTSTDPPRTEFRVAKKLQ